MPTSTQFPLKQIPTQPPTGLESRAQELRANLKLTPAALLAARTGCTCSPIDTEGTNFQLLFFDSPIHAAQSDLIFYSAAGDPLPVLQQTLLLYYFSTADGAPGRGEWDSFADLPDGRTYDKAFQGYTGDRLVQAFGLEVNGFNISCLKTGGRPADIGDASYTFQALPRVPLLITYWIGEGDFPSSCKILFDKSVSHYLPTDVCAVLASILAHRILSAQ